MNKRQRNKVILYYEIRLLHLQDFSVSQISKQLSISRTTVYFYMNMSESDFLNWLVDIRKKSSKFEIVKDELKNQLIQNQELSASELHLWLSKKHPELGISRRSISNYIKKLRAEYNLPKSHKNSGKENRSLDN